jgi:aspartate ammonia-lyase
MTERKEHDLLGELSLPADSLYGIHTKRAMDNFPFAGRRVHPELIKAIALIKAAAARVGLRHGWLEAKKAEAIIQAAEEVAEGRWTEAFPLPAWQGGAGTSTHLNVCEVIANRAIEIIGGEHGDYSLVHPIEDVNRFQSTNDVYPTALRIAAIRLLRELADACAHLQMVLQEKEAEFAGVLKLGRTELQDAVPITLGQEFAAYAQAVGRDRWRLYKAEERLRQVNLGGTAVGTGLGASWDYIYAVNEELRVMTGLGLARAENMIDPTQNMDVFVEVSGLVKTFAVTVAKISRDLRLLSSGPAGGFGEIKLKPRQAGSSLMPGKVNPVIPEAAQMTAYQVMAHDFSITMAAQAGELELNAMVPLIAHALLESLELLTQAAYSLADLCLASVEADADHCTKHLESSTAAATALAAVVGYEQATKAVAKAESAGISLREAALAERMISSEQAEQIFSLESLTHPAKGRPHGGAR